MTYTDAIFYMQTKITEELNDELTEIHLPLKAYTDIYFELYNTRVLEVVQHNGYNFLSFNRILIKESHSTQYIFKTKYNQHILRSALFGLNKEAFPQLFFDQY